MAFFLSTPAFRSRGHIPEVPLSDSRPPERLRVGIHQAAPGTGLRPRERAYYRDSGIDLLVFPEYFWVRPDDADHDAVAAHHDEDVAALAALSREEGWIVAGGTVVEPSPRGPRNACPIFHAGHEVGRYHKIHLMPGEIRHGVVPGDSFTVVTVREMRLAPVICADVLHEDTFHRVAELEPDLIVAPVSSPYRQGESHGEKESRDQEIFLRGARRGQAALVKAGATGTLFGRPLQGRSLVASSREILFRTPFHEEHERRTWVVEVPLETRPRG